jgi:predicted transglutaminase-like cysteine proteinase
VLALCRASPGDCPSVPTRRFLAIIASAQARQGRARLGEINRAINLSIRPMSDLAQYGVVDLWTSPLATLATGAGDCEDYAIAKYVALREAGLSSQDLRLLIVRDTKLREDHAVVVARLDGRWLVLDNRRLVLLEDVQLKQYAPMFEIDDDGVKRLVSRETIRSSSRDEPNARPAAADAAPGA